MITKQMSGVNVFSHSLPTDKQLGKLSNTYTSVQLSCVLNSYGWRQEILQQWFKVIIQGHTEPHEDQNFPV